MKSIEGKILSMIALVAILAIAPVSTVALAQTTIGASSDTEVNVQNGEGGTSISARSENEASISNEDPNPNDKGNGIGDENKKDQNERMTDRKNDRVKDTANIGTMHRPIDRTPDVKFMGTTNGFMVFGGLAHHTEIGLHGTAFHVQDSIWQLRTDGKVSVADREAKLEMKGFTRENHVVLHGSGELENGEKVRLFLRGHFAPTPEAGKFALAFTHAGLHNIDTGEKIPLMLVGTVKVTALTDIDPMAMFANSQ